MPRKKAVVKRRRKDTAFNATDFIVNVGTASAGTRLFTNGGLMQTFIDPFLSPGVSKVDGVLDVQEMFALASGGSLTKGSMSRFSAAPQQSGRTYATEGLGGVIMDNVRANIIPSALTVFGLQAGKKIVRKTGISRSMNRILKQVGLRSIIKF